MKVVIAGGGIAALEALLALRRLAEERVRVTLISPDPDFVYRPMLIAEPFDLGRVYRFSLARIAAHQGAALNSDRVVSVFEERRVVRTGRGDEVGFDLLLVALGARPAEWLPGALTFGMGDAARMRRILAGLEAGTISAVAFVVPDRAGWALPVYELALMTANRLGAEGRRDTELALVTPEALPLELFGTNASDAVSGLLSERGVRLVPNAQAVAAREGSLELDSGAKLSAQAAVTMPRLEGPRLEGLAEDADGFIPVDERCRIAGSESIYAAGDVTSFPVKQGGIATQQADAAAADIAARSGAGVEPAPFRPVLRGMLLTGGVPEFLRASLAADSDDASVASVEPLWWPPGKIAGRYLAPYLAEITETAWPPFEPEVDGSMRIEVRLD
jgi:sulfide:quinone oxidoreductase